MTHTRAVLPDCLCQPATVGQMQCGDRGRVSAEWLMASVAGTPYLLESATLVPAGDVGVERTVNGYVVDVGGLPRGYRVRRWDGHFLSSLGVVRVQEVRGTTC